MLIKQSTIDSLRPMALFASAKSLAASASRGLATPLRFMGKFLSGVCSLFSSIASLKGKAVALFKKQDTAASKPQENVTPENKPENVGRSATEQNVSETTLKEDTTSKVSQPSDGEAKTNENATGSDSRFKSALSMLRTPFKAVGDFVGKFKNKASNPTDKNETPSPQSETAIQDKTAEKRLSSSSSNTSSTIIDKHADTTEDLDVVDAAPFTPDDSADLPKADVPKKEISHASV